MLQNGDIVGGKYRILDQIGKGGMSTVYRAVDENLGISRAIKVAEKKMDNNDKSIDCLVADRNVLTNFRHSYLPGIVDVIDTENSMMLVMDYIDGESLDKILKRNGSQEEENVIKWGIQLCSVLGYLHDEGIVYRDLKPNNIMLRPNGDICLIDFGTAKEYDDKKNQDTISFGTIGYHAPEQSIKATKYSDIYSLGATLRYLITGIDPQDPSNDYSLLLIPIREINSSFSEGLEFIISKCLNRSPNDRYQSAQDVAHALEHYKLIGKGFRKKQKRKLYFFLVPLILSFVFGFTSLYCYSAAQNLVNESYDAKIAEASNIEKTEQERRDLLIDAIGIDSTRDTAYLNLIDLFLLSGKENGSLSRDEGSTLIKLNAGIDIDTNGTTETIQPLRLLESENKDVYEEICYQIGITFWYDYEVYSDRYTNATEWFNESIDKYPVSQIYVNIGECQKNIKKYKGQNRTEDMYNSYEQLWNKLNDLLANAEEISDNDTKILIWNEIITNANEYATDFNVKIGKEQMLTVIDEIADSATNLKSNTTYQITKDNIDNLVLKINETKNKINTF